MSTIACAELLRRGDPDRFLATMAAPVWARDILFPIYAFNVEVARAPWATAEPMIAEMRLQWWRDVLSQIAAGEPVARHDVSTPLAGVLDAEGAQTLDRLVNARRWDIESAPFESVDALDAYLADTGGGLLGAATAALGGMDSAAAAQFGQVGALANYLLAVPALTAAGRQPLPVGGIEGLIGLVDTHLTRLTKGPMPAHRQSREMQIACLSLWRARPILEKARRDPNAVLEGRLATSEFRRRTSLFKAMWFGI